MQESEGIVRDFIEAWSRLDAGELAGYFREDGVYHNMPARPVSGRANIEKFIRGFTASWTETRWDIITLMARENVVMVERLDRTRMGARGVDLPCAGVFELEGGKIRVWRDYFDLATYQSALE